MARPSLSIEQSQGAGDAFLAIVRGQKTLKQISDDLGKSPSTVIEVVQGLEAGNWIIRTGNDYTINRQRLIDFCVNNFKLNKKELTERFDGLLELLAFSRQKTTIESLGIYFNVQLLATKLLLNDKMPLLDAVKEMIGSSQKIAKRKGVKIRA